MAQFSVPACTLHGPSAPRDVDFGSVKITASLAYFCAAVLCHFWPLCVAFLALQSPACWPSHQASHASPCECLPLSEKAQAEAKAPLSDMTNAGRCLQGHHFVLWSSVFALALHSRCTRVFATIQTVICLVVLMLDDQTGCVLLHCSMFLAFCFRRIRSVLHEWPSFIAHLTPVACMH